MGMDLMGAGLSYNWEGWKWLVEHLSSWGVDISEFRFTNDGDPISGATCAAVADAIEVHLDELTSREREWLEPHIKNWRKCRGCDQW